jgi:hypothetical protein
MKNFQGSLKHWVPFLLFSFACIATYLLFEPFARVGIDPHHDGIMLKPALDVASGQVLFRETFSQYGALTTYIQALFVKIWGPTLLSLRWSALASYIATAGILTVCWRAFLPATLIVPLITYWLVLPDFYEPKIYFQPWSSVYAIFFQSLAYLFLIKSVQFRGSLKAAFLSGLFAGLTFWCRFPVGFTLFFSLAASYLLFAATDWKRKGKHFLKALFLCAAGFKLVHALFLLNLLRTHSLADWFYQNFGWPSYWASVHKGNVLNVLPKCLTWNMTYGVYYIASILLILGLPQIYQFVAKRHLSNRAWFSCALLFCFGLYISPRFQELVSNTMNAGYSSGIMVSILGFFLYEIFKILKQRESDSNTIITQDQFILLGSSLLAMASWLQYYPEPCGRHRFWALTPALGIFIYSYYKNIDRNQLRVGLLLVLLIWPVASFKLSSVRQLKLESMQTVVGVPVLQGMRGEPELAKDLSALGKVIQNQAHVTHTLSPILIEGPDALYGALSPRLENPGPLYVRWGFNRETASAREKFIEEKHPIIVVQTGPSIFLSPESNQFLKFGLSDSVQKWVQQRKYVEVLELARLHVKVFAPQR